MKGKVENFIANELDSTTKIRNMRKIRNNKCIVEGQNKDEKINILKNKYKLRKLKDRRV